MSFINANIPVTRAWNMLCEAVAERQEFFGSHGKRYLYYRIPETMPVARRTYEIRSMIPSMREAIGDLVRNAFNVHHFGQWAVLTSMTGVNPLRYPDEQFWQEYQIDPYPYLFLPETLPSLRHSVSQFISTAAGIVNDAVLYPRPAFDTAYPLTGFGVDADLALQWGSDYQYRSSGTYAENGYLSSTEISSLGNIGYWTLAVWEHAVGRGRADNLRWIWRGGGQRAGSNGNYYYQPQLSGSCRLRSRSEVVYTRGYTDDSPEKIDLGTEEFTMDFATGQADRCWELAKISNYRSEIWNSENEEEKEYMRKSLDMTIKSTEVLLTKENFPALNYKYLE